MNCYINHTKVLLNRHRLNWEAEFSRFKEYLSIDVLRNLPKFLFLVLVKQKLSWFIAYWRNSPWKLAYTIHISGCNTYQRVRKIVVEMISQREKLVNKRIFGSKAAGTPVRLFSVILLPFVCLTFLAFPSFAQAQTKYTPAHPCLLYTSPSPRD